MLHLNSDGFGEFEAESGFSGQDNLFLPGVSRSSGAFEGHREGMPGVTHFHISLGGTMRFEKISAATLKVTSMRKHGPANLYHGYATAFELGAILND